MKEMFHIRELEISITSRCTLACADCGFLVPEQPEPYMVDPTAEIGNALDSLYKAKVRVGSLAILGGEPTINGELLEGVLSRVSAGGIAERVEVVTNGLTPRGLTKKSLRNINRLSVSVYGLSERFISRYRAWISLVAPHVELIFRMNEDGWDPWVMEREVSAKRAQTMFDDCWYRRHCTTVERGRLFVCSRIAKLARDDEGLEISPETTLNDVTQYMTQPGFLPSCKTCTPMMGFELVPAGVQPDDRIQRLEARAIAWLDVEIRNATKKVS